MEIVSEVIRSRQNRTVVRLAKLTDRKEREATGTFRFDGRKLAEEAIRAGVEMPAVFLREDRAKELLGFLGQCEEAVGKSCVGQVFLLENSLFDRVSEEKSPEGLICVAKYLDKLQKTAIIYEDGIFREEERIVLLEAIRDPVNLGAVIRSAAAFGVDRLILSSDCADLYHPRTVRASMGTLFRQKVDRTPDLTGAIASLRRAGRRVFAAVLNPQAFRLGETRFEPSDCVVIGNEGHGLSEETVRACSGSVYIPMGDRAESLNAAVSASILMWEFGAKSQKREENGGI